MGCMKKNKDETLKDEVEYQHNNANQNEDDWPSSLNYQN